MKHFREGEASLASLLQPQSYDPTNDSDRFNPFENDDQER